MADRLSPQEHFCPHCGSVTPHAVIATAEHEVIWWCQSCCVPQVEDEDGPPPPLEEPRPAEDRR